MTIEPPSSSFADKARWHAAQRRQPPREKIRILLELQRRESESNGLRTSLGQSAVTIVPWKTEA
jgi:hypothetical protein